MLFVKLDQNSDFYDVYIVQTYNFIRFLPFCLCDAINVN